MLILFSSFKNFIEQQINCAMHVQLSSINIMKNYRKSWKLLDCQWVKVIDLTFSVSFKRQHIEELIKSCWHITASMNIYSLKTVLLHLLHSPACSYWWDFLKGGTVFSRSDDKYILKPLYMKNFPALPAADVISETYLVFLVISEWVAMEVNFQSQPSSGKK